MIPIAMNGQKMAVDPNNPNVVYVGTPQNGLFVTTDGGASWQKVSAVPVSAQRTAVVNILALPASHLIRTSGVTGGKTNTIYASSYGHGVYESTNGGASWTALSGGPSDVEYATVSSDRRLLCDWQQQYLALALYEWHLDPVES